MRRPQGGCSFAPRQARTNERGAKNDEKGGIKAPQTSISLVATLYLVAMALRFLLVAALALVANAFQAPVSVVSRSVQQQQRAQFSVTMMADEVEDKVRTLNRPLPNLGTGVHKGARAGGAERRRSVRPRRPTLAAASAFARPSTHYFTFFSCYLRSPARAVCHSLFTQVKGIIAEQLGVELDSVTPAASFTEDLGADSLDAVELIMAIEEAFDIEIPDEEAETMTTPADCVTAIKAKL